MMLKSIFGRWEEEVLCDRGFFFRLLDDAFTLGPGRWRIWGGRRETKYSHGYSTSELETLATICEVLLPPIPLNSHHNYPENDDDQSNKAIESFYKASGSQYPVPDEVAELVVKRGFLEGKILVRIMLKILSTRLGTLLICGVLSFGNKWPYLNKFSEISLEKREKVVQKWFKHWLLTPVRLAFVLLKFLVLFVFFTQVGEDAKNPAWKAMDYHVDTDSKPSDLPKERPLDKEIVETSHENESTLANSLSQKGLKVTENAQRKDYSGLEGPSMNQLYESGGILSTLDGKTMILAGSTVGGGSAVNWSACIKTPDFVMNEWANDEKLPLFASHEYRAAMDKVCKRIGVTEKCDREGFQNQILRKGRQERNRHNLACRCRELRCGYHHGLQSRAVHNKRRWENEGEEVFGSGCKMHNKFRHQKEDANRGQSYNLCMWFTSTPPLLIKSGLRNRNIGRNLHLHPVLMAWGYFPEKNSDIEGKVYEGGIITSVHKVCEDDSNVRALIESPILGPGQFAALCPWESGIELKNKIAKYSRTAHLFSMIRDGGNGEVLAEGRISYNLNDSDKENMKMGLRRALRILIAAGAVEVGTHQSDGQKIKCEGISEEKVNEFLDGVIAAEGPKSFVRNWTTYCSAHQMGSCRMGTSEKDGAVDENGESWEAEGLFVCDASVLPSAVGVNPMITIQTTSYCLSIKIAEKLKNGKLI
ncbi:hypothetical protein DH2020_004651 [Rehmannia glutinosa]|uniref:Long-chain-alcohol oxidase n=1 Tax=Rehmannia glutinosa TaxID=99300 RepID=A0ABR0XQD9_REHGL